MRGILGGTGLYRMTELTAIRRVVVRTPYGLPSGAITFGRIGDCEEIAFMPRHGYSHSLAPHDINYRANLWALHHVGVRRIVAVTASGSLHDEWMPGSLVVPDQIIDYTWGREGTFVEGKHDEAVVQVDMTLPYSMDLRAEILEAARLCGVKVIDGATYGCTQGPRFETAAEIRRMKRDGCDLVGQTGMPEAALARELGLAYCSIAVVANHAAGVGGSAERIHHEHSAENVRRAIQDVQRILGGWCQLAAGSAGINPGN